MLQRAFADDWVLHLAEGGPRGPVLKQAMSYGGSRALHHCMPLTQSAPVSHGSFLDNILKVDVCVDEHWVAVLRRLVQDGKAYPCFCTDEELTQMKAQAEAESRPPIYTGRWAHASSEEVEQEKAKVCKRMLHVIESLAS